MVDGSFLRYYDVQGKEKNDEIKKIRWHNDHFRNIKVNLILFIAVILGVNFVDGYIDKPEFIILIVNVFNLLNLFLYTNELNKADSGKTFVELKSVKQIFENDE